MARTEARENELEEDIPRPPISFILVMHFNRGVEVEQAALEGPTGMPMRTADGAMTTSAQMESRKKSFIPVTAMTGSPIVRGTSTVLFLFIVSADAAW